MPIMFADLVPDEVEIATLMLARHHSPSYKRGETPFDLWRAQLSQFEIYQKCQAKPVFRYAKHIASFVVTPGLETLFVGIYANQGLIEPPSGLVEPLSDWEIGEAKERYFYELEKTDHMLEFAGKLSIDWGSGALAWVQYAKNPKPVTQLSRAFAEEPFPGLPNFLRSLSEMERLPAAWIARLQEARGIYALSCPITRELYVGSATGEGGFYERWRQHAKAGGDAKMLRSREPSDYQVAILEVAGSNATKHDILQSEYLWMRKLQTNEMGLNGGGMLRDGKEKPVTFFASPPSAARP